MPGKFLLGLSSVALSAVVAYSVTQNNANTQLAEKDNQITQLETQLQNEKTDKQKYYDALQEAATTLEAKNILIENLTNLLNTTQSELVIAQTNYANKQSELEQAQRDLNEVNANIATLETELNSVTADKVAIQSQLDTALENKATLETEIAALTLEFESLQLQVNELIEENDILKSTIESLQALVDSLSPTPTSASLFTFDGEKCTGYIGPTDVEEIVIPKTYSLDAQGKAIDGNDYIVKEIGSGENGSSVVDSVFAGKVIILNNITKVNNSAFYMSNVSEIDFSKAINIESFSGDSIYACNNLTTIDISSCIKLRYVTRFVYGCQLLKNIYLPNSILNIGSGIYLSNEALEYNYDGIDNNCKYLGNKENPYMIFMGVVDTTITDIALNENTEIISNYSFNKCNSLTNVVIPSSVRVVCTTAFPNLSNLKNIDMTNCLNLSYIGNKAFYKCSRLKTIYIPSSVIEFSNTSVDDSPFNSCSSLLKIYCGAETKPEGYGEYWNYYNESKTLQVEWGVTPEEYAEIVAAV